MFTIDYTTDGEHCVEDMEWSSFGPLSNDELWELVDQCRALWENNSADVTAHVRNSEGVELVRCSRVGMTAFT